MISDNFKEVLDLVKKGERTQDDLSIYVKSVNKEALFINIKHYNVDCAKGVMSYEKEGSFCPKCGFDYPF